MKARLVWGDENYGVQGFNVYRDVLPLDPEALPAPLASLGPSARSYEDETIVEGETYYYVVTALVDGQEPATANFEVLAEEPDVVPTYEVYGATGAGRVGTIQTFTVPSSGLYRIVAYGAQGGKGSRSGVGGRGAKMSGWFDLVAGQVLEIGVGHQGNTVGNTEGPSGGGASWVSLAGEPLVVAGGGGGYGVGTTTNFQATAHAHTETWGKNAQHSGTGSGASSGNGGVNGNGGAGASSRAAGGAGWFTDGGPGSTAEGGGQALSAGGLGGDGGATPDGGFGGGGANDQSTGWGAAGGGGGYSGGGGAYAGSDAGEAAGGGGGSFNSGIDQDNLSAAREGDGQVVIYNLAGEGLGPG